VNVGDGWLGLGHCRCGVSDLTHRRSGGREPIESPGVDAGPPRLVVLRQRLISGAMPSKIVAWSNAGTIEVLSAHNGHVIRTLAPYDGERPRDFEPCRVDLRNPLLR